MTSEELRAKAVALADEIDSLGKVDEPDDAEVARLAEAIDESGPLAEEIRTTEAAEAEERTKAEARAAAVEIVREFAAKPSHVEAGATFYAARDRDPYDLSEIRMGGDPIERAGELRGRALDAIESAPAYLDGDSRQRLALLVENTDEHNSGAAEHLLRTGSPRYARAFRQYLQGGMDAVDDRQALAEVRTALSTSGSAGGYLIPFHLDPTVVLTSAGQINPFRRLARVETITSNVWHGVTSAGSSAEWTSEAAEVTDASPTFVQPSITPIRGDVHITASMEVTQDSNIASQLGEVFADAKDAKEAAAFATGTGTTQPIGVFTSISGVTASRVAAITATRLSIGDIVNVANALPARHQDNASWVGHWSTYNLVRQFNVGATGQGGAAYWTDLNGPTPPTLLGFPAYKASSAAAQTASNQAYGTNAQPLVLGDFKKYVIVDRMGAEIIFNPLVLGASALRPTGQVSWTMFFRVGADVIDTNAFRQWVA